MESNEVLKVLHISRQTLTKYVKNGLIKVTRKPNGWYDYDTESIYAFLNKDVQRRTYIYARVSTRKQMADLDEQKRIVKEFCDQKGYQVDYVFSDIASGTSFEKRTEFFQMLDDVFDNQVKRIVVTSKDRLTRAGIGLLQYFLDKFHCEIVAINEKESDETDDAEIFEDLKDLFGKYSTKQCSKRRIQTIEKFILNKESEAECYGNVKIKQKSTKNI